MLKFLQDDSSSDKAKDGCQCLQFRSEQMYRTKTIQSSLSAHSCLDDADCRDKHRDTQTSALKFLIAVRRQACPVKQVGCRQEDVTGLQNSMASSWTMYAESTCPCVSQKKMNRDIESFHPYEHLVGTKKGRGQR